MTVYHGNRHIVTSEPKSSDLGFCDTSVDGDSLGTVVKRLPLSKDGKTALNYQRQDLARELLPERIGLQHCMHSLTYQQMQVDVMYSPTKQSARYNHLQKCKDLWGCSICASTITERRAKNLEKLFTAVRADRGDVVHVAFTVRHSRNQSLAEVKEALRTCRDKFTSCRAARKLYKKYGVVETVTGHEITYSLANGWHPHDHAALILEKRLSDEQFAEMESDFKELWVEITGIHGGDANYRYGVKLSRDHDAGLGGYLAKSGRDEKRTSWSIAREIAKAPSKSKTRSDKGVTPFQLLDLYETGDKRAGRLFQEYARTMRGSRQLVPSKGIKAKYGIDLNSIEELPQDSDYEKLLALEKIVWQALARMRLRAELLIVASHSGGNPETVEAWVDTMLLFGADLPTATKLVQVKTLFLDNDIPDVVVRPVRDPDVREMLALKFLRKQSEGSAYTAGGQSALGGLEEAHNLPNFDTVPDWAGAGDMPQSPAPAGGKGTGSCSEFRAMNAGIGVRSTERSEACPLKAERAQPIEAPANAPCT